MNFLLNQKKTQVLRFQKNNPTFADDYYEAILGVYAMYGKTLGLYPISLVLGGPGAEMAVQC